jgi:ketosteroid isomerase-like protein
MRFITAMVLFLALPAAGAELPADLAEALKAFDRAHFESDVASLTRLTSDSYMIQNSDLSLEDKKQFLADYGLPGFKIDPYVRSEESNSVWPDAAVTAGVVKLSWTQDGRHQTRLLRYVDIWRKQEGRWLATFTQVTRVKSPD